MCIKKTLGLFLNVSLMLTGGILIGGACITHYVLLKKLSNDKVQMDWIVYVLGAAACLAILAALIGIFVVCCWEICFFVLVALILIVAVIILELVFLLEINRTVEEFQDYLKHDAKEHMKQYGEDVEATEVWDLYQKFAECCGLSSPSDWEAVSISIPTSCCKEEAGCDPTVHSNRYEDGCYLKIKDKIEYAAKVLKILVGVLIIVQLVTGTFNVFLLVPMSCLKCC